MERNTIKKIKKNGGQAMITSVVFFLFLSLTTIAGLVSPTVRDYTTSRLNLDSKRSYYLAESGNEDYVYRVFNGPDVDPSEVLTLEGNSVTTTLVQGTDTYVEALSNMMINVDRLHRKVKVFLTANQEASFSYGLQVGEGGLDIQGSNVSGNVFSNGPITGDQNAIITGTAISASSIPLDAYIVNGSGTPTYDLVFGNHPDSQDIAQGVRMTVTGPVKKVQFYIKRSNTVGLPNNATVRIVNDNNGMPGSTTIASGSLLATSVGTNYSWVEVPFTTSPILTQGSIYWIIIDVTGVVAAAIPHYLIATTVGIQTYYIDDAGFIGRHSDYWIDPPAGEFDYYFRLYLGGVTGLIQGTSGNPARPLRIGTVAGDARANNVHYTNVTGSIYCQNGSNNNKECTNEPDILQEAFPIPESYITNWKAQAEANGVYNGNYSVGSAGDSIGPLKINGDLSVGGGGILTVNGTLWVTGNISLTGGARVVLSPSYGSNDGVLISDGTISMNGGATATGSGMADSYIMLLSTSSSSSAISVTGGSGAVILYAANGTLNISGGATINSATAYRINVSGGSELIYDDGLEHVAFSSASNVATLTINGWEEVQ